MGRERQLSDAFVGLADTRGEDFDVVDLFDRLAAQAAALSSAAAAGIMMSDGRGRLRAIAASQQRAAFLELFQLQTGAGPCIDCYRSGAPVIAAPIQAHREQWPQLVAAVQDAGFGAMATVPLRLRASAIGAVNLFYTQSEPPVEEDLRLVQALSDVAALAMLRWPAQQTTPEDILARLQATITNKVAIEQAKGVLAQYGGISIPQAGQILHSDAQSRQMRITDIARAVVRRTLPAEAVLRASSTHAPESH